MIRLLVLHNGTVIRVAQFDSHDFEAAKRGEYTLVQIAGGIVEELCCSDRFIPVTEAIEKNEK